MDLCLGHHFISVLRIYACVAVSFLKIDIDIVFMSFMIRSGFALIKAMRVFFNCYNKNYGFLFEIDHYCRLHNFIEG